MASSNILSITLLLCFFRLSGADNTRDNKEGFETTPAKAWTPWKKEPPVGGAMPNLDQIRNLLQKYSPLVYFHPDEQYLPSSVSWFFNNGALLYSVAKPNSPTTVDPTGRALPQGGTNDGVYWLDLTSNEPGKDKVKAGELSTAEAYVHVKPARGGTATDIVYWLFYPFNGPGRVKVESYNITLGHIGEHVGDWEHLTLRISNVDGELMSMYFSQHSSGEWVEAMDLEYSSTDQRPAAYATINGHAFFSKAGLVLQGEVVKGIGLMDETAEGGGTMDLAARAVVVAAEYLDNGTVAEPPWLQYTGAWGPKVKYDLVKEMGKAVKSLPEKVQNEARKLVEMLPPELLGKEGPTGPKVKASWNGDEVSAKDSCLLCKNKIVSTWFMLCTILYVLYELNVNLY